MLVTDEGEEILRAGDAAGFKRATRTVTISRTVRSDAMILEIGNI